MKKNHPRSHAPNSEADAGAPELDEALQAEAPAGAAPDDGPGIHELPDDAAVEAGIDSAEAAAAGAAGATAALEKALEAERDKYLRLAAEFENFRRRTLRERQEAGWRAQAELVQGLLDVLDDIMRFAHVDPTTVDAETVVHGVALVEKKIFKSLGGHGLELLNPVDHPFDPAFHEAVGTEPAETEAEDHLIAKVYQPGYVFRGQLLRPARVVVRQWLS